MRSVDATPPEYAKECSPFERAVQAEIDALSDEQREALRSIAAADNLNHFLGDYRLWKDLHFRYLSKKKYRRLQVLGTYVDQYRQLYKPFRPPPPQR